VGVLPYRVYAVIGAWNPGSHDPMIGTSPTREDAVQTVQNPHGKAGKSLFLLRVAATAATLEESSHFFSSLLSPSSVIRHNQHPSSSPSSLPCPFFFFSPASRHRLSDTRAPTAAAVFLSFLFDHRGLLSSLLLPLPRHERTHTLRCRGLSSWAIIRASIGATIGSTIGETIRASLGATLVSIIGAIS
jgi:hypothetical protein